MNHISLLLALAASASAEQPPVAVTNSPPPLVAVPAQPAPPFRVLPPPPTLRVVRPPQWRRPAQSLITPDDYPASARARGEQGWVAFTLEVDVNGRVSRCTVTGSSGSEALDHATCMIMRRRARFTPAIDSTGMPAPWVASGEVGWRLP